MKRLALCLFVLCACDSGKSRLYDNNDLELATGYTAKELCSCLFVMEMPMSYCSAWTKASPAVTKFSVDFDKKTVESTALVDWGSKARFVSMKFGCVLDD
jgi:hypothetical protein